MSDCFVLYLLLTCMKKKTSGADKFTNNTISTVHLVRQSFQKKLHQTVCDTMHRQKMN